jgi:hypothetical protein
MFRSLSKNNIFFLCTPNVRVTCTACITFVQANESQLPLITFLRKKNYKVGRERYVINSNQGLNGGIRYVKKIKEIERVRP